MRIPWNPTPRPPKDDHPQGHPSLTDKNQKELKLRFVLEIKCYLNAKFSL